MNKSNDILSDIVHVATQAILCDDENVKRLALGDIADVVSRVIRGTYAATEDEIHEAATEEPVETRSREDVEVEKQKQRMLKHFSFCNGLFPIHTVRTPSGCMGKSEINGRKFSFSSVDDSLPNTHACTVQIWDGGEQIMLATVYRGKSIAGPMAMGALKAYVKQLAGSKKFHSRGGFLKQALKRWQEAQAKEQE